MKERISPQHDHLFMIGVNFHQLYVFHTVARMGSFSKGAEVLSISQPAVSIQMRDLEKSMDCTLLFQIRRGLQLTDTGHAVFSYTQCIFHLTEEMPLPEF